MSETVNRKHTEEKQPSGIDHATMIALGFGLHCAWVCTSMYSTQAVLGATFVLPGVRGGTISLIYLFSVVAFALTMFVAATFDQRLSQYSRSRIHMAIAACATSLGTLLGTLAPHTATLGLALECLSGVVTGIGSAGLMLYWGITFAREKTTTIVRTSTIAVCLGFALNALFIQQIPLPFGGIAAAAIPLAEFALLHAVTIPNRLHYLTPFNAMPTSKLRLALPLLGASAFTGIALGLLKQASIQTTFVGTITPTTIVLLLLGGSLVIALFSVKSLVNSGPSWDFFLRVVAPLIACLSLVVSLLISDSIALSDLFLLVAYLIIETLAWVHFTRLARRFRLSPIFLIGLSRGMLCLGMFAGAFIAAYMSPVLIQYEFEGQVFITLALATAALGYALLPRESELMTYVVQCPVVRLVSLDIDEGIDLLGAKADGVLEEKDPSSLETSYDEQDAANSDSMDTDNHSEAPSIPVAAIPVPDDEDVHAPVGRFSRKVRRVAEVFLLTKRETDILFELAKGNSPAYIQEKLFLSEGTVKTHIRNIYRKCDIHKRNDLLRLIEEIENYD